MSASSCCGLLIEFTLERAEAILLALSIDILLSPITVNTISKFNDFNKMGRFMCPYYSYTRILRISLFLVPRHDPWSCISAHIGLVNSFLLSLFLSERIAMKYFIISITAIATGTISGRLNGLIVGIHPLAEILVSVGVILGERTYIIKRENATTNNHKQNEPYDSLEVLILS